MAGYLSALQWQIRPKLSGWDHIAPGWAGGAFPCLGFGHGSAATALIAGSQEAWQAAGPMAEDWTILIAGVADEIDQCARGGTLDAAAVEGLVRACLAWLTGARPGRVAFLVEQILLWYRLCPTETARRRSMAALRQAGAALLRKG